MIKSGKAFVFVVGLAVVAGTHAANPTMSKYDQLFCNAAENKNIDMMNLALAKGANVDTPCFPTDVAGIRIPSSSLYHYSSARSEPFGDTSAGMAVYLIEHGANVNLPNAAKRTPLFQAVEAALDFSWDHGQTGKRTMTLLLDKGADVNATDIIGNSVLIDLVSQGYDSYSFPLYQDVFRTLIGAGAKVNRQNKRGWSPLMAAAQGCGIWSVQNLLSSGADVHQKNKDGNTALDLAIEAASKSGQDSNCNEVVQILTDPTQALKNEKLNGSNVGSGGSAPGNPLSTLFGALQRLGNPNNNP